MRNFLLNIRYQADNMQETLLEDPSIYMSEKTYTKVYEYLNLEHFEIVLCRSHDRVTLFGHPVVIVDLPYDFCVVGYYQQVTR